MRRPESFTQEQADRLARLYERADREITRQIRFYVDSPRAPGTTRNLQSLQVNIRKIRADLLNGARTWTEQVLPEVYQAGMDYADKGIPAGSPEGGFFAVHQQAVQKLADEIYGRFREVDWTIDESVKSIARRWDDIYRAKQLEYARGVVVGNRTWQQAARDFKRDLARQGITAFYDKSGRRWELARYTKMATTTVSNNCFREGTKNRVVERGHDLVRISSHTGACKICQNYQGKTFSISGNDPDFPSLVSAIAGGLFHPYCKHHMGLAPEAKDRWFEVLEGEHGEANRQAEIDRLARLAGWTG